MNAEKRVDEAVKQAKIAREDVTGDADADVARRCLEDAINQLRYARSELEDTA